LKVMVAITIVLSLVIAILNVTMDIFAQMIYAPLLILAIILSWEAIRFAEYPQEHAI